MTHHLYRKSKDTGFYEVGFYTVADEWIKESDHQEQLEASRKCEQLNRDEMIWQRKA